MQLLSIHVDLEPYRRARKIVNSVDGDVNATGKVFLHFAESFCLFLSWSEFPGFVCLLVVPEGVEITSFSN